MQITMGEMFPYGITSRKARNPAYDRDIVITSCAVLEQALETAILSHINLRPDTDSILFSSDAPVLRGLGDKIQMAYLLGIVGPETRNDLGCIRAIRNTFAHTRGYLDFDVQELHDTLVHITAPVRAPELMKGSTLDDPRERFIRTCFELTFYLIGGAGPEPDRKNMVMGERRDVFRQ
ncbi:MAG: hypothetical protein KDE49_10915 [Novosphingobium sp.]|nr:hypothetical protein [Novosphingobium sp.]